MATGQHEEDQPKLKCIPRGPPPCRRSSLSLYSFPSLWSTFFDNSPFQFSPIALSGEVSGPPAALPMPESAAQRRLQLFKQHSWSPDADREEAWLRRKAQSKIRRSRSVTDDDLDELKACVELGFGFNSPEVDPRLSRTFPALGFYHAVHKHYNHSLSTSSASLCSSPASGSVSPSTPAAAIINHGETPEMVKTKLKQWAQVVACSVRQCEST